MLFCFCLEKLLKRMARAKLTLSAVLALVVVPVAPYTVHFGNMVSVFVRCPCSPAGQISSSLCTKLFVLHVVSVDNSNVVPLHQSCCRACMPTHMCGLLAAQVRTSARWHHTTLIRRGSLAAPAAPPCLRHRVSIRRLAVGRAAVGLRMSGYPDMGFDFESAAEDDAVDPEKMCEDMLVLVLLLRPPSLLLVSGRGAYGYTN
jgi:hypothetical protein